MLPNPSRPRSDDQLYMQLEAINDNNKEILVIVVILIIIIIKIVIIIRLKQTQRNLQNQMLENHCRMLAKLLKSQYHKANPNMRSTNKMSKKKKIQTSFSKHHAKKVCLVRKFQTQSTDWILDKITAWETAQSSPNESETLK